MIPRIELPTESDFLKAEKFFDYRSKIYSDEQRKNISNLAYKIMLRRKTKQ